MKNKKQANAKEEVDFSTLPKATTLISSLMFDIPNPDTKLKIFEKFYKTCQGDPIHFIARENIIEYAKSVGIYVDPSEGKKPNPKDTTPIEKKEITPKELATACLKLINEKSVTVRKDKKVILDSIQEAEKLKEESIKYYEEQKKEEIVQQEKETKKKAKKKGAATATKDTKKAASKEMPKPEEIEIPKYDSYGIEMMVILFNYPLNEEELLTLIEETNEFNDHIVINLFQLIKDLQEFVEEKQEVVLDKKGKPIPAKDNKVSPEVALMQKYLELPPYMIPPEPKEEQPPVEEKDKGKTEVKKEETKTDEEKKDEEDQNDEDEEGKDKNALPPTVTEVFELFNGIKNNSDKLSDLRKASFMKEEFNLQESNIPIEEYSDTLFKSFIDKMFKLYAQFVYFTDWNSKSKKIKLNENEEDRKEYSQPDIMTINKGISFEDDTFGRLLLSLNQKLIEDNRSKEKNKILYETDNYDNIFTNGIKEFNYEHNSIKTTNIFDENLLGTDNKYLSHPEKERIKEHNTLMDSFERCDINSSPFKQIIYYHDLINRYCKEEKIGGKYISILEKQLNYFLGYPHVERCLEKFYSKETLLKLSYDFGNNNLIYPFIKQKGLKRDTFDRFYVLSSFEKMVEEKVPEQKINFLNRIYEEKLDKDLFKQVLAECSLYDYEIVSKMDDRTKKTFLAFYYRCPKGRVYRKQKKGNYLSSPDFENWVKFYSPKFKQAKQNQTQTSDKKAAPAGKDKDKNVNVDKSIMNTKYELDLDEELEKNLEKKEKNTSNEKEIKNNPKENKESKEEEKEFYEADDLKVGEMKERLKYMFPADNGIIVKKEIDSGIFTTKVSYIRKDEVIFGIKKTEENMNEFWLNFDKDLKLSAVYKDDYSPFFKNAEDPSDIPSGTYITFTSSDGILIQIMPNGEICQKKFINEDYSANSLCPSFTNFENHLYLGEQLEHYRMIGLKGNVVKYYPLETKILYSNGNYCSIKNNVATNINNNGYCTTRPITDETDISEADGIPISRHFDPETNSHSISRQDNVVVINYPDSGKLVIHEDDTKIYTSPSVKENTYCYIENKMYPPTEIRIDQVKKRTKTCLASGTSEALMGSEDIMERSYDGRVAKIVLPDNTIIQTYKEKKATEEFDIYSYNNVTLVKRPNGTILRIDQDGEIVLVTSKEREILDQQNPNPMFSSFQDTEYMFEINGPPKERKGGVYSASLKEGKIFTKDYESNIFEVHSNGIAKCKIQGTTIREMNEKTIEEISPISPRYEGDNYINPETRYSAPPSNFYPPRLFVVDNDLTAVELLNEEQLRDYKLMQKVEMNEYRTKLILNGEKKEHFWIKKQLPLDKKIENSLVIPNLVRVPQKYIKQNQTDVYPTYPQKEIYIVRKIIESPEIKSEERDKIMEAISEMNQFLERAYVKREKDKVDQNIILMNQEIQKRIIRTREASKKSSIE